MSAAQIPDICRSRHGGSSESEAANARVHHAKYELRAMILHFFRIRASAGASCEEAARELGVRYTTASARISELKADGELIPTGERKRTSGGSTAAILRVTSRVERERVRTGQGLLFKTT